MEGLTRKFQLLITLCALGLFIGCSSAMMDDSEIAPTDQDSMTSEDLSDLGGDFSEDTSSDSSIADNSSDESDPFGDEALADDQSSSQNEIQTQEDENFDSEFESLAEESPKEIEPSEQAKQEELPADDLDFPEELPPVVSEAKPEPIPELPPAMETQVQAPELVTIQSIQFKANDNGGTIVVQADGPVTYKQRMNSDTHQLIVEIPNSILPSRLKRPLVTKDIPGTIGVVNAYQSGSGNTTNVVVQVREGYSDPTVQVVGNSLLIVSNPEAAPSLDKSASQVAGAPKKGDLMSYASLEEFLSQNGRFYGEKVNLQFDEAVDVREILKFLADEAAINMIIADEVKGNMSLKLRNIAWDQAFVLILKSKKLSYTRTGNVIRVAPASDIQKEQEDALKLANSSKDLEPLRVRLMPVSYAKVEDMAGQIKGLLSKRGTVIADARTTTLVVSDIEENLEKVDQLIKSIDLPPQQVMIEGKIIEALDEFSQNIGVNWGFGGGQVNLGSARLNSQFASRQVANTSSLSGFSLNVGTIDILGNIDAAINLSETEGTTKVLSAPRIMTLNNEQAEIKQTLKLPSQQTTTSSTGSVSGVTYTDLSLSLNVTPQITNDGHVIMNITANRDVPTNSNPPQIQSRNTKTKVMVRNGQTAVIGGIYQNDTVEGESRFPGLSKIPILGWMFKASNTSNKRNELMIFLTPKIVARK